MLKLVIELQLHYENLHMLVFAVFIFCVLNLSKKLVAKKLVA